MFAINREEIFKEVNILKNIKHKNILNLVENKITKDNLFIIMELC